MILTSVSMNALRNSKYRSLTIYFYLKALTITDMVALFFRCGIEPIRGLSLKFNNFFIVSIKSRFFLVGYGRDRGYINFYSILGSLVDVLPVRIGS